MSVQDITTRHIHLTAALQIDGLDTVWYLGPVAPSVTEIAPARGTQTAKPGLNAVGDTSSAISLLESVPQSSTVSVVVDVRADNSARDLLRIAPYGASATTTLAVSLAGEQNAGALIVEAVDAIDGFPASGYIWIGQECIRYTSRDTAARTFTAPATSRGWYGTRIQRHTAAPTRSLAPRIYAECTSWKRRTARVWVGQVDSTGAWLTAPVVEAEGYISGMPQRDRSGAIEIEISTLPTVLDREFGGAEQETTLQRGWHLFDGEHANRFDAYTQIWTEGSAFSEPAQAALVIGGNPITMATRAVSELFKPDDPLTMGLVIASRPAAGIMPVNAVLPGAGGADDPTGSVTVTGGVVAALAAGDRITNSRLEYVSPYTFGTPGAAAAVEWPAAVDGLSDAMQASLLAASPGAWAATSIDASGTMTITPQWSIQSPGGLLSRWLEPNDSTCWGLCPGSDLPARNESGIDYGDWPAFDARRADARRRWPRPAPAQPPEVTLRATDAATYTLTIPDAWWQPPERYMLVEDSIAPAAAADAPVWVIAKHQRGGEDVRSAWPVVSEVAASTITAGCPGYALEIRAQDRTGVAVAALEGSEPPLIRAAAAWRDESTTTIIRQMLGSYTGTGSNGADDVQPYGLGVPSSLISSDSFGALGADPLGPRSLLMDEGEDAKKVISALCRSIGAVLTERLDQSTGRRVLSVEPIGLPVAQQTLATITDGDWLVSGRPVVTIDPELVNRTEFGMQWGDPLQRTSIEDTDRGDYTVAVVDRDSEGEHGGTSSESLALYGIRADNDDPRLLQDTLLPIAQARFAAYGHPRRIIQGQVAYSVGSVLYPGAAVTIAARELDGYDGQPLASTTARILSVERGAMSQTATIRAAYWAANTGGIAPAVLVSVAAPGLVATVTTAAYYAPATAPSGSAQVDTDLFAVGDAVSYVPRGDFAGRVDTTITAIVSGTSVTVADALPAGAGSIRPRGYTVVSSTLAAYAYMADAAGLDFSDGDPARVYS